MLPSLLLLAGLGAPAALGGPAPVAPILSRTAGPEDGSLERRLAALRSPDGAARASAERWLATHVTVADFPRLAAAAQQGDVEVRGRLASAVGADARHLALAVLFLEEPRAELAAIGEEAIERMALRFNPDLGQPGLVGSDLRTVLFELGRRSTPRALRLDAGAPLERSAELLRSEAKVPIALVRTPSLRERDPRADEALLVGAWEELVLGLALVRAVGLEAHGIDRDLEKPRGWLQWVPAIEVGRKSGVECLIEWCRDFVDTAGTDRVGAARALAACGWPAALAWLEERWRASSDQAALEGLLLAAADDRVAIALTEPEAVRALFERAEADLDAGGVLAARGHRILRALERVGCRGPRGEDLAAAAFAGFATASEAGRWLRFAVLEAWGCGGSAEARAATRTVLEDEGASAALRVQALRAWAALDASAPEPQDPPRLVALDALLAWPSDVDEARELAALLAETGATPPASWTGGAPGDDLSRAVALGWWFDLGDVDAAAASVARTARADAMGRVELFGELLRTAVFAGERERVEAVLERARAAAPEAALALDRLALLAGTGIDPSAFAAGRDLAAEPLSVLGALAGVPSRPSGKVAVGGAPVDADDFRHRARARLVAALGTALEEGGGIDAHRPLLDAFERALEDLYGASDDLEAEVLLAHVARVLGNARSPLRRELQAERWPPPPRGAPDDLARSARHWSK